MPTIQDHAADLTLPCCGHAVQHHLGRAVDMLAVTHCRLCGARLATPSGDALELVRNLIGLARKLAGLKDVAGVELAVVLGSGQRLAVKL